MRTARLLVRPPQEADRGRFAELFYDEDFMVFYPGVLTEEGAQDRFDHMVAASQNVCRKLGFTFWKQAPVEGDIRNLYTLPVGDPPQPANADMPAS